jgi:GT2 family glycosyltransferase
LSAKLSLIILNWNGRAHLDGCLNSIKAQITGNHEVIVVDNASVDDSIQSARQIFPSAIIMALDSNDGFCKPNNLAAKQATGDYLVFLNNDIVLGPDFFNHLDDAIQEYSPDLLAVRMLQLRKPDLIDNAGIYFAFYGAGRQRFLGLRQDHNQAMQSRTGLTPSGACFVIRREVFLKLGGFDESLFFNQEDNDLGLKALEQKLRCVYTPLPTIFHYGSASANLVSEKTYYYMQRNNELVFWRHLRNSYIIGIVLHFAYFVFHLIKALRASRVRLFFRAKMDAMKVLCRGSAPPQPFR